MVVGAGGGACEPESMDADTTRECGRLVVIAGLPGRDDHSCDALADSMPACRTCPDDWMMASGIDLFGIAISDKFYDVDTRVGFWVSGVKESTGPALGGCGCRRDRA